MLRSKAGITHTHDRQFSISQINLASGGDLVRRTRATTKSDHNKAHRLVDEAEPRGRRHRQQGTVIVYTAWNLWKERCRRVFNNKAQNEQHLLPAIKDDVQAHQQAWEELESPLSNTLKRRLFYIF